MQFQETEEAVRQDEKDTAETCPSFKTMASLKTFCECVCGSQDYLFALIGG